MKHAIAQYLRAIAARLWAYADKIDPFDPGQFLGGGPGGTEPR